MVLIQACITVVYPSTTPHLTTPPKANADHHHTDHHAIQSTMQAVVVNETGGPEVLKLVTDHPKPTRGPKQASVLHLPGCGATPPAGTIGTATTDFANCPSTHFTLNPPSIPHSPHPLTHRSSCALCRALSTQLTARFAQVSSSGAGGWTVAIPRCALGVC